MTVQINRSREPLDEQDLIQVETRLNRALPKEYRDFLTAHNGGRPEPNAFPIYNNPSDDQGLVHNFMCIKDGDIYDLLTWVDRYRDRVPSNFLPIAKDPGGNLICLSISGEDLGKVYFWDHEEEAATGQIPGYDNVYPVANSFQEFLSSLHYLSND